MKLAIPFRMGICSLLTAQSVSVFNPKILELLDKLAQANKGFNTDEYNSLFKEGNKEQKEALEFETAKYIWVLDQLCGDSKLDKTLEPTKLILQYEYFEGRIKEEEKTRNKIKENLKEENMMQIRRVMVTPTLVKVKELSTE